MLVDGIIVRQDWDFQPDNTSVREDKQLAGVKIYPNPLEGNTLYITRESELPVQVSLLDLTGKILLQRELQGDQLEIQGIAPGLYLLRLEQSGHTSIQKLIIR